MQSIKYDQACKSCQAIQGHLSLTNVPRILETPHWIVEHIYPTSILGWLVLVINRHAAAVHDLTPDESRSLGEMTVLLCRALHDVLQTEKEYVAQWAEGPGFQHVHFHIIPRGPAWPEALKGPSVFSAMGAKVEDPLPAEVVAPIAAAIREYLRLRLFPT